MANKSQSKFPKRARENAQREPEKIPNKSQRKCISEAAWRTIRRVRGRRISKHKQRNTCRITVKLIVHQK